MCSSFVVVAVVFVVVVAAAGVVACGKMQCAWSESNANVLASISIYGHLLFHRSFLTPSPETLQHRAPAGNATSP